MVEDVEELRPEFGFHPLTDNRGCFGNREVKVGAARPPEKVPRQRAIGAHGRIGHCRRASCVKAGIGEVGRVKIKIPAAIVECLEELDFRQK